MLNSRVALICFINNQPVISTISVINRKKGNVFRYCGTEAWKYRVIDAKKQINSIKGERKFIRR
jgi:hypothetical protein